MHPPPHYLVPNVQNVNVMYQKILNGTLKFPGYLSEEAQSLLSGLLTRNVDERLGSGPADGEELREHPFFDGLDWDALLAKEITPAFLPVVSGVEDTGQIDPVFLQEQVVDTPVDAPLAGKADEGGDTFAGFTFVGGSAIGGTS